MAAGSSDNADSSEKAPPDMQAWFPAFKGSSIALKR
jgi:hypothetical protein